MYISWRAAQGERSCFLRCCFHSSVSAFFCVMFFFSSCRTLLWARERGQSPADVRRARSCITHFAMMRLLMHYANERGVISPLVEKRPAPAKYGTWNTAAERRRSKSTLNTRLMTKSRWRIKREEREKGVFFLNSQQTFELKKPTRILSLEAEAKPIWLRMRWHVLTQGAYSPFSRLQRAFISEALFSKSTPREY